MGAPSAAGLAGGAPAGDAASGTGASGTRRGEDPLVRLSRGLLFLGMLLLPLTSLRLGSSLDVSDGVFALAAGSLLFAVRPPRRARKTSAWYLGTLLVTVAGVVSCFDAVSPFGSLKVVGNGLFVLLVWQWSARQLLDSERRTQGAMTAVLLGSTISAGVALAGSLHHASGASARAAGLTQQPNIAGITFALAVVLGLGLTLTRGRGRFAFRPLCTGLCGIGLMVTGSVSGMGAALVGLVVLLALRGFRLRNLAGAVVVLGAVYLIGTHVELHAGNTNLNPLARIHAATGQNTGYNTITPRMHTLANAWSGIEHQPLVGHGLDQQSAQVYFDPSLGVTYPTHDFPLLLWYEGGVLMLFGMAVIIWSAFRWLTRSPREPTSDILLAGCVAVLLFALQAPELFDRWLWVPFVLAMTLRGGAQRSRPPRLVLPGRSA